MIETKSDKIIKIISYFILALVVICCIAPLLIIVSASFSDESLLASQGYGFFPKGFNTTAYKYILSNGETLFRAYGVTIATTAVGSFLNLLVTAMCAYPLARKDYKLRSKVSFFLYFTMLFNGGTVPTYILISQYLHLRNNVLVLILPQLMGVYNVFIMRTYFSQVPTALIESAKIDGAGEYRILFKIILPLAKTGLATMLLLISLTFWNQWYPCLLYMSSDKYITLQYYLARIMSNIEAVLKNNQTGLNVDISALPNETARMAICVLGVAPMVIIFTCFQKYFVKGINVGAVKG